MGYPPIPLVIRPIFDPSTDASWIGNPHGFGNFRYRKLILRKEITALLGKFDVRLLCFLHILRQMANVGMVLQDGWFLNRMIDRSG